MLEASTSTINLCLEKMIVCSLKTSPTSIAIRISQKNNCIEVIDNGRGLSLLELENLDGQCSKNCENIFMDSFFESFKLVRAITSGITIMTKQSNSDSYIKVFGNNKSSAMKIIDRPTHGMTVIVKDSKIFIHEKLQIQQLKTSLALLALNHSEISFSVYDKDLNETIFGIEKHKKSPEILKIILQNEFDVEKYHFFENKLSGGATIKGYVANDHTIAKIQKFFFNDESLDSFSIAKIIHNILPIIKKSLGHENSLNCNLENSFFIIYIDCFSKYNLSEIFSTIEEASNEKNLKSLQPCLAEAFDVKLKLRGGKKNIKANKKSAIFVKKSSITRKRIFKYSKYCSVDYLINKPGIINEIETRKSVGTKSAVKYHQPVLSNLPLKTSTEKIPQQFLKKIKYEYSKDSSINPANYSVNKPAIIKNKIPSNKSDNIKNEITSIKSVDKISSVKYYKAASPSVSLNIPMKKTHMEFTANKKFCSFIEKKSDYFFYNSKNPTNVLKNHSFMYKKNYSFLPSKLTRVLHGATPILTSHLLIADSNKKHQNKINLQGAMLDKIRRNDQKVRPCEPKSKMCEMTLTNSLLNNIKILNQVDLGFITAITELNDTIFVILIDQHAMDERIRYESLLRDYRNSKNIFKSMRLNRPIEISKVSFSIVSLVVNNRSQLFDYGINAVKKNDCTIIISTIPKCLGRIRNIENLTRHLENLLNEISEFVVKDVNITTIPITIHNAIASEACHGAIKFGDTLDLVTSQALINQWIVTDMPNRCAHGRPVIIPLMQVNL